MEDVRGRFVWHQLMTRDVPGAKKYYSKLLGWNAVAWPLDPAYTVCNTDAGPVAGIMEIPGDVPAEVRPHWVQYIGTRDVDATADAAVRAGGSVMKAPSDMQGAGRYAVLKDPQGALFAIIAPENPRPEPPGNPPLGHFSWHELATTDHEAAFAFYSGLFGWDAIQRMDMGPLGVYLIFGQNGVQRGGIYNKPADSQAPPNWLPYALVANADRSFEQALSTGGQQVAPPMEVPGGSRVAIFTDPAGAPFAVHSLPGAAASSAESAPRTRPAAKSRSKTKAKAKTKATRKPAAKKKVARKAAKRPAKKVARKAARKAKKSVARRRAPARKAKRKPGARRKK